MPLGGYDGVHDPSREVSLEVVHQLTQEGQGKKKERQEGKAQEPLVPSVRRGFGFHAWPGLKHDA